MKRPRSKEGGDLPTVIQPGRSIASLQAHTESVPLNYWDSGFSIQELQRGALFLGPWCCAGDTWSMCWGHLMISKVSLHSGPQISLVPWNCVKNYLLESKVKTHVYNFWPAGEILFFFLPSHPSNVTFGKEMVCWYIIFDPGVVFSPLFLPRPLSFRCKKT